MRIHVLVEGLSEENLIVPLCRRLLPGHALSVIVHQGKGKLSTAVHPQRRGLLDQLVPKLRAYGRTLDSGTDRVLVLVDADADDCGELKGRLESALAGVDPQPTVLFRIAVEETEAFYLGDARAIKTAFPQANLAPLGDYVQDSVCGTWEVFQRLIGAESEDKPAWATQMGPRLSIRARGGAANRSPSFHQLRRGLLHLAGETDA